MKQIIARPLIALMITLALCLASQALYAQPASKIQASYDVIGFGMTLATITETYTRSQDSYQIESVTKAVGLLARLKPETIRITSQGKITPQGMRPHSFILARETETNKNASAKFNWEKKILTRSDYKGINDMPLPTGTQDRLSVLYHLPIIAKSDQTEFDFGITDGKDLENYRFTLAAEQQNVSVPLGTFTARYVSSTPVAEEIQYEVWMATERDNFPYKIIVTDAKGNKLTQVLTELTITP